MARRRTFDGNEVGLNGADLAYFRLAVDGADEVASRLARQAPGAAARYRRAPLALAAAIALIATACDDTVSPPVPFAGQVFDLVAIDGQPLPAQFERSGATFLVGAGAMEFVTEDTLKWDLWDLTAVEGDVPALVWMSEVAAYRQPSRDSLEIGASESAEADLAAWAFARRSGDVLVLRTLDPAPLDPLTPDPTLAPLGRHSWRFERRE